jgi:transcriptional regulator with XRE-family HTH domain
MKKKKQDSVESKKRNFAKALEHFRKEFGLTKKAFAEKGDISRTYYNRLIKGDANPSFQILESFCYKAGIPFEYFLNRATLESIENFSARSVALEEVSHLISNLDETEEVMTASDVVSCRKKTQVAC